VCGEVAHAAVLCPSFYEVKAIANPGWWTRVIGRLRRRLISALATA
jgi:indolepyruvate ferredoxin oxidoreductase alpha subunit